MPFGSAQTLPEGLIDWNWFHLTKSEQAALLSLPLPFAVKVVAAYVARALRDPMLQPYWDQVKRAWIARQAAIERLEKAERQYQRARRDREEAEERLRQIRKEREELERTRELLKRQGQLP